MADETVRPINSSERSPVLCFDGCRPLTPSDLELAAAPIASPSRQKRANGVSSVSFDPTRIPAQVVTGIGFLGAGAIIRYGGSVRGLTTAAALWVTAAVCTAVGFGFWDAAIATTVVTVVALYGLKWFERKTLGRLKRGRHEFAVDALPQLKITDLAGAIESRRARIISVRMESDDQGNQQLMLFVQLPGGMSPGDLLEALKTVDGVASISWLR